MTFGLRTRNPDGSTLISEEDFLTRFLISTTIAWDDQTEHVISHAGFASGTPFYVVDHPHLHSVNVNDLPIIGYPSEIQVSFSGTTAIYKQVWKVGSSAQYIGRSPITIHFGVY
ncbi:hypothetical protein OHW32_17655 [Acinetobacter baumannii]|nr:hypothetical protein [Acinetobacter baumannii]